jgi:hypothetical protein
MRSIYLDDDGYCPHCREISITQREMLSVFVDKLLDNKNHTEKDFNDFYECGLKMLQHQMPLGDVQRILTTLHWASLE